MLQSYEIKYSTMKNGKAVEKIVEMPVSNGKLPKLSRWKMRCALLAVAGVLVVALYAVTSTSFHDVPLVEEKMMNVSEYRDKIRYKHTKRQLPQSIIIGCRKAGTRALLSFLNLHPQIQTAKREVHFFDDDEAYSYGLDWYRKKMPYSFTGQVTIEKTPAYFSNFNAPKRIAKMNSTIKLLLIVRDPTERTISDYLQLYVHKKEKNKPTSSFEELVIDPKTGEIDPNYPPLVRSLYNQYMWNWLRTFPLEQFLIISGEELVKNPLPQLRRVEKFLQIDRAFTEDMFFFNETRGFYCLRNDTTKQCLQESKGRKHPDVDPVVIHKLHAYFKPYNEAFYQLVKWNFGWPTE